MGRLRGAGKKMCNCYTAAHCFTAEGDDFSLFQRLDFVGTGIKGVLNIRCLLGGIAEVAVWGEFEQRGFGVFGYVELADKFL